MAVSEGADYAPDSMPQPVVEPGEFVFAAMHLDPPRFPAYLAFGLLLGALRLRSAGLCAPILAHMLNNAFGLAQLASS